MIKEDNLEFSFSGLKSAFINFHHNAGAENLSTEDLKPPSPAYAVMDHLCSKNQRKLLENTLLKPLVVASGVKQPTKDWWERLAAETEWRQGHIPPLRSASTMQAWLLTQGQRVEQRKTLRLGLNVKPSLADTYGIKSSL